MPDQELTFTPLDRTNVRHIEEWMKDRESRRWIGGLLPTEPWLNYHLSAPACFNWIVYHGATAVGQIGLEIEEDDIGWIGILVNPVCRGQGYGQRMIRHLCQRPEAQKVSALGACVDPKNPASMHCFKGAGFTVQGACPDADDELMLVYPNSERR